ncbi:hypothetical protein Ate01nite_71320 [Actinoplanes teichomyceticus]|nr:hypothetical protein Ate01nite_71320 [Actinoplanes teichomyceticus]
MPDEMPSRRRLRIRRWPGSVSASPPEPTGRNPHAPRRSPELTARGDRPDARRHGRGLRTLTVCRAAADPVCRAALLAGAGWLVGFAVLLGLTAGSASAARFVGDIVYAVPVVASVLTPRSRCAARPARNGGCAAHRRLADGRRRPRAVPREAGRP